MELSSACLFHKTETSGVNEYKPTVIQTVGSELGHFNIRFKPLNCVS